MNDSYLPTAVNYNRVQGKEHQFYYMNLEKDPKGDVMKRLSPGGIRGFVIE